MEVIWCRVYLKKLEVVNGNKTLDISYCVFRDTFKNTNEHNINWILTVEFIICTMGDRCTFSEFPTFSWKKATRKLWSKEGQAPSVHWPFPLSWTLTASCPVYVLKVDVIPLLPIVGDLGADSDSWLFLGIVYSASAKSAARFKIISLGSFSGSPGCRGINFCKRWNP